MGSAGVELLYRTQIDAGIFSIPAYFPPDECEPSVFVLIAAYPLITRLLL